MPVQENGLNIKQINSVFLMDIVVFMLVFLTSSFMVTNDILSSTMTTGLWVVLAGFIFLGINSFDVKSVVVYLVLAMSMMASTMLNGENTRYLIIHLFSFFVVLCITNTYSSSDIFKEFIRVMYFLAIISLIGYAVYMCMPSFRTLFLVRNKASGLYSNWILFVHGKNSERNQGIFWEPGAYQTFLCLALMYEVLGKHINLKRVLVFSIAIITTFSTTGYIAFVVILLLSYMSNNSTKKSRICISCIILIALILLYLFREELFDPTKNSTFGKLVSYANDEDANQKVTSVSSRVNSVVKPISAFLSSPLLGVGYEGLNRYTYMYTNNMNTCTFINWFAVYGIFYGLTMLTGYWRFACKLEKNIFSALVTLLALFLITASENYVDNPFFIMIAMYGHLPTMEKKTHADFKYQLL